MERANKLNAELREWDEHTFRISSYIAESERKKRRAERLPSDIEIAAQLCIRPPEQIVEFYSIGDSFLDRATHEKCVKIITRSRIEVIDNKEAEVEKVI